MDGLTGDIHATDRYLIQEVLQRYFFAMDVRDYAALATCFSDDIAFTFNTDRERHVDGRGALVDMIRRGGDGVVTTTHTLSNCRIEVSGDRATSITNAVAHVMQVADGAATILTRGLRYDDELVKAGGRWMIARRRHQPTWQHDMPATNPNFVLPHD